MGINKILKEIAQIETLVAGWSKSKMSTIEREIVLEKLRSIYEEVIFIDNETILSEDQDQDSTVPAYSLDDDSSEQVSYEFDENQNTDEPVDNAQEAETPTIAETEQPLEEIVYIDEEDSQIEIEDDVEDLASLNPNAANFQESEQEQEQEDNLDQEIKDMLNNSQLNDIAINSLYGDAAEQEDTETEVEESIIEEAPAAVQKSEPKPIKSIRESIGMNDKYLMTRSMFDSDSRLFEQTINELDQMTDFNDAILYVSENFSWNPDDNSVKLLISILEEKLL